MTRRNRNHHPGRAIAILIAAAALFAVLGFTAQPVSASEDEVATVSEDHYVYCGGTYDFIVRPGMDDYGDPYFKAQSYHWKVKMKAESWSSSASCEDTADPGWWYDTETSHFKMNMKDFYDGSDDEDWGLLQFYCEVTDTMGKVHRSKTFRMHVGSRDEFRSQWKTRTDSSNHVTMTNVTPAAGSPGVTKINDTYSKVTMEVGQSKTFSFTSSQKVPAWLQESDPYLKNYIGMISADGSEQKNIDGNSYTFKPAKAGEYLILMNSTMLLGSGYDPYHPDLAGLGVSQSFQVTVTEPSQTVPERTTVKALSGVAIKLGKTSDDTKTYKEIPAAGSPIPATQVIPSVSSKAIGVFSGSDEAPATPAGWYKHTDTGWQPVESLKETTFQAGCSYRFQVAVTAKDGNSFDPDDRSADVTVLRNVLVYESGKAGPNDLSFTPNHRDSTSQRVVYVIRSFTLPEAGGETPSTDDISGDFKKDLSEDVVVSGLEDVVYNGKNQTPTPIVTWNDQVLKKDTDYTVAYGSNKDVGEALVFIQGKGEYTGTMSCPFNILPKGRAIGSISAAKKALTVKWKKQATKMSVQRISGYEIRYGQQKNMSDASSVKVEGYKNTSKKLTGLEGKTLYYVQLRTYMDKDGKTYASPWSKVNSKKTK